MALACVGGCVSDADRVRKIRHHFYTGDLAAAAQQIEEQIEQVGHMTDVLRLDQSLVQLAAGEPREAEQTLRLVRDRFDHLEQASLGGSTWTMATDDNGAAYAGEDYEKVLVRVFLALSNLMTDGQDAAAYCLQITDKQQQIIQAGSDPTGEIPQASYKQVALGAYLHGLIREETHTNYDDAERSFARVVSWEPGFRYGQHDLQRARNGRHSAPGSGVLNVLVLVGRGPYKEEVAEEPTSAALLIADRILSATAEHSLPPTIAPVKVPRLVVSNQEVSHIAVSVGDQYQGTTETITDVSRMALEQHAAIYPRILARAVVRRIVKKGVIYSTKDALIKDNSPLVSFAFDMAGVVWEAAESADVRCWGLLPDKIQVIRLELPVGDHRIGLQPLYNQRPRGLEQFAAVSVEDGRNTYLLANFPGKNMVGKILASRQPAAATTQLAGP